MLMQNRKAKYDYEILRTLEAGIVLEGWEVKSLLKGKGQLTDSYVIIKNNEAFLLGSLIQPLLTTDAHNIDTTRTRKLLLKKREIQKLQQEVQKDGRTIVCTKLYYKNKIKAEIALAKGRTNYDKRHVLKERAIKRENEINTKR